ncbi:MAG: multicopper oxidase domain-containing protein [Proteobacteria bacterium]|nr:multicopper oxidase domain-containing protein [Pseudomonadota bacterium]
MLLVAWLAAGASAGFAETVPLTATPGYAPEALRLGRDLDGDGDPDEIFIELEVIEVEQEIYPGEVMTFWVFAPAGQGMASVARAPSPTIRVEQGDIVRVTLRNTHYFPHTIHFHGTIHPNAMDGVPDLTQNPVVPGDSFTYEFVAMNPGTHFYHCHVQPDVHVEMGLAGMFVIEPNRPDNHFAHIVPGAGAMPDLSRAAQEAGYDREYSLVYMDAESPLHRLVQTVPDPRELEWRMHRDYDSSRARADTFMLNGRSFPYTLRDTPIRVAPDQKVRLRVLNAGERTVSLHTHGHHPVVTARDGVDLAPEQRQSRDVFTIGPAQRVDLELRTTADDRYASGPGVWAMHDHTELTVTNRGISPGGDLTAIVYDDHWDQSTGLPKVAGSLERFFDPAYYRGEVPVFGPGIFHTTAEDYGYGWAEGPMAVPDYPKREARTAMPRSGGLLDSHRLVANSCARPRGKRRIVIAGGVDHAREGEVFGFAPREFRVGRCEQIELVFENEDDVRHAFMIPGLNPMAVAEFTGPGSRSISFVTPDEDVTLEFHCHVETHERMGMAGRMIVGAGSPAGAMSGPAEAEPGKRYVGFGVLLSVDERLGRVVIDHEEIEGFMAAMTMSYAVEPPELVRALPPDARVRFVIDANRRAIVEIAVSGE